MDVIKRPDFQPKGKDRIVPVSAAVYEHLAALHRPGDDYIVSGGSPRARENLIKRDFAGWMRELGWDAEQYPKAAHELRKLIGSRWYTERGAEVAQNWLGHADITTTCRFYATLSRQPDPLEMD